MTNEVTLIDVDELDEIQKAAERSSHAQDFRVAGAAMVIIALVKEIRRLRRALDVEGCRPG